MNCLGQGAFRGLAQMPTLGIAADQQRDLNIWQGGQQRAPPFFSAAFHGWDITTMLVISRKAKPHRHNSDARTVVESRFVDPHPATQTNPGRIEEGYPALHCKIARSLTCDQNGCRF